MPVVTRTRSVRILLVVAAGFPLLLAGGAAVLTVVIGQSCTGGGIGDAPSDGGAYAARVIADAHAYKGAGTISDGAGCSAAFGTPIVPGTKARILADGVAVAPADAPAEVQAMIAAGNRINHFPYSYGGAHGDATQTMNQTNPNPAAVPGAEENGGPGYDCSSATSYVLRGGGLGHNLLAGGVLVSGELESIGDPGPGKVGDDLRERGACLHRGCGHLLRHRRGPRQPAQPTTHRPALEQRRHRAGGVLARHPPGL